MKTFLDIQVGDRVVIVPPFVPDTPMLVTKITPKRIFVDDPYKILTLTNTSSFDRETGRSQYYGVRIQGKA